MTLYERNQNLQPKSENMWKDFWHFELFMKAEY